MSTKIIRKIIVLAAISYSSLAAESQTVTIAGFGGNDIFTMNHLLKNVLAEDLTQAGISVKYFAVESDYPKYILNALSSGNAPDAFYVNADVANPWINTGKLAAISSSLTSKSQYIHPVLRATYQKDNVLYAVPKDLNALALQFNQDIFDDAVVDYPSSHDDWYSLKEKLSQVVKSIGDEGVTGLCITADFNRFAPFALATGWQPFDHKYKTVLDANFKRAFEFYTSLVKDKVAILPADLGQNWGGGCFAQERAAVTIEGNWIAAFLQDKAPNLLYRTVLLPKDPLTGGQGNLLFSVGWGINKDSPVREAVETVIALLTGRKAQLAVLESGLALPSLATLDDESYFQQPDKKNQLAKIILEASQVEHVISFAFGPYGNNWMEPIQIALSSVFQGQLTVEQALSEAQDQYDQLYAGLEK